MQPRLDHMAGVYPRVCGGTREPSALIHPNRGLSPRVRGNLTLGLGPLAAGRSIPACAGEPRGSAPATRRSSVYPRVCGGTLDDGALEALRVGLSPRVRGNRGAAEAQEMWERSIPACAGEPQIASVHRPAPRVYPRVCGGTAGRLATAKRPEGLSPRVRGNPGQSGRDSPAARSIPACAGEPNGMILASSPDSVYPRVCGGTARIHVATFVHQGLSPRVRGNPVALVRFCVRRRSIPACAGEPPQHAQAQPRSTVYPRVCGGTESTPTEPPPAHGLSPRVRGNLVPS